MAKRGARKPVVLPPRTKEEEVQDLINEFRGTVDESLIVLIGGESSYDQAREELTVLSVSAIAEADSGFDPSGLQGPHDVLTENDVDVDVENDAEKDAAATPRRGSYTSSGLASTSQNTSVSDTPCSPRSDLPDSTSASIPVTVGDADEVAMLCSMFPMLKVTDIRLALRSCKNDLANASEYLLNIQLFEETGERPKGIDGFFHDEPDHHRAKRGGRAGKIKMQKTHKAQRVDVGYKLKPAPSEADDGDDGGGGPVRPTYTADPRSLEQLQAQYNHLRERSREAGAAGVAEIRRGKSNPAHFQAADVYFQRRNETVAQARALEDVLWDRQVDAQSAPGMVDVHFVPVDAGVAIALDRTQRWWDALGENRVAKARSAPLQVVTGRGVHSSSGSSQMYARVGRALESAGWKTRVGVGYYYISGRKLV